MNEELIRLKFSDKTTQWFPLSTMSGEVRTEGLTVIVDDIALNNTMSGVANYELADGTALTFPLAISGQKVTFPMTTQLVRDGEVKLQLEIYDGNNVYKSAVYKYIVNKSLGYVTITNEEQQIIQSIVIEENKRVIAEDTRIENESTRVSSETVRIENENVRIENENARVSSEIVRIENENVRELTEEERVSSETVRIENEETRVSNENERIANENTRISNEDKRQASITDIEKRFSSLTTAQQQQAEVADARMDTQGFVHANLKTRLDEDFKELASKIPTDVAMNGYESVTTNDTLSGEVSSAVLTGNTMVNITGKKIVFGSDTSKIDADGYMTTTRGSDTNNWLFGIRNYVMPLKPNTVYTALCDFDSNITLTSDEAFRFGISDNTGETNAQMKRFDTIKKGISVVKFTTYASWNTTQYSGVNCGIKLVDWTKLVPESYIKSRIIILEGDHTDKPLEFFEGLKSAEVAEIGTHGVNLVDCYTQTLDGSTILGSNSFIPRVISNACYYRELDVTKTYRLSFKATRTGGSNTALAWALDENLRKYNGSGYFAIRVLDASYPVGSTESRSYTLSNRKAVCIQSNEVITFAEVTIVEVTGSEPSTYVPYQESKTTFTPIKLRSSPNGVADTYDVDTGILTRRCGEVVLNGSESGWSVTVHAHNSNLLVANSDSKAFIPPTIGGNYNTNAQISNNFLVYGFNSIIDSDRGEGLGANGGNVRIVIKKSKLATPDVAGFKAWLTANPTTVVYQLATPTTEYIENNGQLRSYDSQTTVFANSVVPVKLNGNIPVNYASTLANLATQARNLRIENTALIEQAELLSGQLNIAEQTNNFQDELIDVSLMATDELYVMLEPLLAQPMMSSKNTQNVSDESTTNTQDNSQDTTKNTQNVSDESTKQTQGGNAMVDAYVAMVIRGLKTIDEVPARYREEVRRILAELDK